MRQINQVPDASGAGYYNPCSGALSIVMPSEAINQVQNPSFELYSTAYSGFNPFVGWSVSRRAGGVTTTVTDISSYITAGNPVWSEQMRSILPTWAGLISSHSPTHQLRLPSRETLHSASISTVHLAQMDAHTLLAYSMA